MCIGSSKGKGCQVTCKKFLDMNQLVNGVPTQNNNKPIPIKILKSKGKIFRIVLHHMQL